jgi:hypothetical protein
MGSKNKKNLGQKQKKKKVIDITKRISQKESENSKTFSEFDTSEQLKKDKREEYVDEEKFMLDPDIPVYNEKQELGYYSYLYDERRNSSAGFFEKINYYFSRRMGSLLNTFKSAKVLGDKEYEKAHSTFKEFSKDKLPPETEKKFNELFANVSNAYKFRKQIFESLYVNMFSKFEKNLQDLIEYYHEENPRILNDSDLNVLGHYKKNSKEKFFSLGDLKTYSKISEVEDKLLKIKSDEVTKTRTSVISWMKNELKFKLDDYDRKWYDYFYAIRNCIAHQDGIISKEVLDFQNALKDFDDSTEITKANYQEGGNIIIDEAVFLKAHDCLCTVGLKIILAFWMKLSKSKSIFFLSYNSYRYFLESHSYKIAISLFRNLLSLEPNLVRNTESFRNLDEKMCVTLDLCYALKKSGKTDECIAEINKIDWNKIPKDLLTSFLIPGNAMLGDIDDVVNYMHKIGLDEVYYYTEPFRYWIEDITETLKFKKAFKEIYFTDYDKSNLL